ncbi:mechanosensitive ion channel family protein [Pantanalinema sp. GBBB05]|uniref:mechanosensitive ion channel family protein n=1 Tax=Pantanalinema sp. GBBB05 TaxID=2604139 RepID=UPI001D8BB33A|nr:mechanosensitive ion channel family protein [Pantanalinema sp. GBBB05]
MHRLSRHRLCQTVIRLILLSVFTCTLSVSWVPLAQSQLPALSTIGSDSSMWPPENVTRNGELETAAVRSPLDDQKLFDVTSPTIWNRDKIPDGKIPIELRVREINDRLWRVLYRILEAQKIPTVSIATLNNRPIIQISEDQFSRPIRMVTVTDEDADYNGKNLTELTKEWQEILQTEMNRMKQFSSPELIRSRLMQAGHILLGLMTASGVIWVLRRLLTRRQQILEARDQQQLAAVAEAEMLRKPEDEITLSDLAEGEATEAKQINALRSQLLVTLQHQFSVKRQLDINKFLKWGLFWIFILIWYVGTYQIMSRIPILMRWSLHVLATPLMLILIWFAISFSIRISKSLIDRFVHSWKGWAYLSLAEAQRIALRSRTISTALNGLVTFVLVIVGIIWTLSLFDIPTSSILAGGAVIGLAISFGSQSLIKDLVNGCLILMEDQFAVGDVIQVGDKSGLVENLNLRVTQLRNSKGELITIPNSNITNVSNLTRLWSRIDLAIVVAYENDPIQVLDVLRQVSKQLYSESEWRDRLTEPPEILGIDDLSHTGMLVRVWIKTAPMEQWSVGREFRLRVRQALAAHNIQLGKL